MRFGTWTVHIAATVTAGTVTAVVYFSKFEIQDPTQFLLAITTKFRRPSWKRAHILPCSRVSHDFLKRRLADVLIRGLRSQKVSSSKIDSFQSEPEQTKHNK
jgi:hypothetical protein